MLIFLRFSSLSSVYFEFCLLPPFAMQSAFLISDYYEGSVDISGKYARLSRSPVTIANGKMKIVGYVFGSLRQCSHACFVPWLTARHKRIICVGRYNMDFRAIFHVRDERKLEPYVWQIQPNPCIFLSSEFSRTKCSLGDLSISCHAMFPCRVSPSGKAI
jgi:hypothetical protein